MTYRIGNISTEMEQDWNTVTFKSIKQRSQLQIPIQNPPGTAQFRSFDSDEPPAPKKVGIHLGQSIQKARASKNMSRKELAVKLNVQQSIISGYEEGTSILDKSMLNRIAKALDTKF